MRLFEVLAILLLQATGILSRCSTSWSLDCDKSERTVTTTVAFLVDNHDADTYDATVIFHWGSTVPDTTVGPDAYDVDVEYEEESESHQYEDGEYVVGYEMVFDAGGSCDDQGQYKAYRSVWFEEGSCGFGDTPVDVPARAPTYPPTMPSTDESTAASTIESTTKSTAASTMPPTTKSTPPPTISSTVEVTQVRPDTPSPIEPAIPTPKPAIPSTPPPTSKSTTPEPTNGVTTKPPIPSPIEPATPTPKPVMPSTPSPSPNPTTPATKPTVPTPKPTPPTQVVPSRMVFYHSELMDPDAVKVWKRVTEKAIRNEAVLLLDDVETPALVEVNVKLEKQSILASRARALIKYRSLRGLQSSSPLEIDLTTSIQIDSDEGDWNGEEIVASAFQTAAKRQLYIHDLKEGDDQFGRVEKMTLEVNNKLVPETGKGTDSIDTEGGSSNNNNVVYYAVAAVAGVLGIGLAVGIYAAKRARAGQSSQASSTQAKPDAVSRDMDTREGYIDADTPEFDSERDERGQRTQDEVCLGIIEPRAGAMDDISTLGDPYLEYASRIDVDNTVGPSVMSAQQNLYVYGVRKSGVDADSTVVSGFTKPVFTDDTYMEDSYKAELGLQQFTVIAPPGKLGLVLDNPRGDLPFVFAVKETSVLKGKVRVGDFLLCVDEIDCRGLSAHDLSMLLNSRSENPERTFVLGRPMPAGASTDLENV